MSEKHVFCCGCFSRTTVLVNRPHPEFGMPMAGVGVFFVKKTTSPKMQSAATASWWAVPHSEHRFRYLPPNSARFSYATEGVLFISAQLSNEGPETRSAPSERFG